MHGSLLLQLLILLVVANGTAVVAKKNLGVAFGRPLVAALSEPRWTNVAEEHDGPLLI